jgi:FixJ family two-component response regulator
MISVPLISIVDDDESVRESLEGLLKSVGFRVEPFALAVDFLNSKALHVTDCLILDVRMPGMSGPELQRKLIASEHSIPIIFITAHGDEAVRARVLGDGAVDCLLKPFNEDALLNAVNAALGQAKAGSACVSEKERKTISKITPVAAKQ